MQMYHKKEQASLNHPQNLVIMPLFVVRDDGVDIVVQKKLPTNIGNPSVLKYVVQIQLMKQHI
jgi:hypothetical protein